MQFQEELYTSAPALLEGAARSNLGIVAKSRGFPREIEGNLAFRQSYSLLAGISVHNPAEHPPRLITGVMGTKKEYFCLSQTVFAGSDHTGRTTPLAHHLVFNIQEMAKAKASPAGILSACSQVFKERWDGAPAWIDPPGTLPHLTPPEEQGEFPGKHWSQVLNGGSASSILAAASDGLLAFPRTQKRLIFCIPVASGRIVARLAADILTLVPVEVQLQINCASHVVESSDCPHDAAIVFTYPNTPFLAQNAGRTDSRAPLLFDLTVQDAASKLSLGKYGTSVAGILRSGTPKDPLAFARDIHGLLEVGPQDPNYFPTVNELYLNLRQVRSVDGLPALAAESARIAQSSTLAAEEVGRWTTYMVQGRLCRLPEPQRWAALAAVAWNTKWLVPARNAAMQMIRDNASVALPTFLTGIEPGTSAERSCRQFLQQLLASGTSLVDEAVARVLATPTKAVVSQAILLINAIPSNNIDRELSWAAQSLAVRPELNAPLVRCILERLYKATETPTPDWLDGLLSRLNGKQRGSPLFRRQVYTPLLRHLLSQNPIEGDVWRNFAARWIEIMLQDKSFDEIRWLVSGFPDRITGDVQDEWRERARSLGQEEGLLKVLPRDEAVPTNASNDLLKEVTAQDSRNWKSGPAGGEKAARRQLSITTFSVSLAVCALAVLYLPTLVRFLKPSVNLGSRISWGCALYATIGAIGIWIVGEIVLRAILRVVNVSSLHLSRIRIVSFLIVLPLVVTISMLCYRLSEIVSRLIF